MSIATTGFTLSRSRARLLRAGLGLFLLLLVYDGAIRKWLLLDYEQYVFILKDLLLCGVIALTVLTSRALTPRFDFDPLARTLFLLYAGIVVVQAFNVHLPSLLLGFWGIKSHLLYAGLAMVLAQAFQGPNECLQSLARLYPWVVIPPCLLAFAQLGFPAESVINQQVRGGIEHISHFGDGNLVRVTGTFSFSTGMAVFVQSAVVLGTGLYLAGYRNRFQMLGLGVALAAMPASGSRSVIVTCVSAVLVMLAGAVLARFLSFKRMVSLTLGLVILGVFAVFLQGDAWEALGQRTVRVAEDFGDQNRAITIFTSAFDFLPVAGPFGFGTGSTDSAATALVPGVTVFSWLPPGIYFEEENGRLVLELGMVGWLVSLLFRATLLAWALSLCWRGRDFSIRAAGVIAAPVMAMGFYVGVGVFAPPLGTAFYWLSFGLLGMAQYRQRVLRRDARQREFVLEDPDTRPADPEGFDEDAGFDVDAGAECEKS